MNVLKNCSNVRQLYHTIINYKQYCYITLLLIVSGHLNAAEKLAGPANVIGVSEYLKVLLGLVFVIGLFFASTYLYKRYGHGTMPGRGQLRIVDGLHLGNRERLVLVELKSKQILLSVTPGQVRKLDVVDLPESAAGSFDEALEQANSASSVNQTHEANMSNA